MSLLAYSVRRAFGALLVFLVVIWLIQFGISHLITASSGWKMGDTAPPSILERLVQFARVAHEWDIAALEGGIGVVVLLGLGAVGRLRQRRMSARSPSPSPVPGERQGRVCWSEMRRVKLIGLVVGLLVCGSLGVVAAVAWSPEGSVAEGAVERVRYGVTETGRVEVVTTEGQVHRVIRWRTKRSGIETQTVEGPLRLRTRGSVYFATPPEGPVSSGLRSMRLPGGILTLPTTTVIQTVTETVQDTTTVIETVTETVADTVTTETGTPTSP